MDVINQSPVTANAEQATTYSVAENENGGELNHREALRLVVIVMYNPILQHMSHLISVYVGHM